MRISLTKEAATFVVYSFTAFLAGCTFAEGNVKPKSLKSLDEELIRTSLSAVSINAYTLDWIAPARPAVTNRSYPVGLGKIRLSRDGKYLIFAHRQLFYVADSTGRIIRKVTIPTPPYWDFQFAPDWKSVAMMYWNQLNGYAKVEVITIPEGKATVVKKGLLNLAPSYNAISWAVDSSQFIYEWDNSIFVYKEDVSQGQRLLLRGRDASYSPDGRTVQFKSLSGGRVSFYELQTKQSTTIRYSPKSYCIWSPDSQDLLCEDYGTSLFCQAEGVFGLVPALHVRFSVIGLPSRTITTVKDYCGSLRDEYGWLYIHSH